MGPELPHDEGAGADGVNGALVNLHKRQRRQPDLHSRLIVVGLELLSGRKVSAAISSREDPRPV